MLYNYFCENKLFTFNLQLEMKTLFCSKFSYIFIQFIRIILYINRLYLALVFSRIMKIRHFLTFHFL